jgi:hypothetical protein
MKGKHCLSLLFLALISIFNQINSLNPEIKLRVVKAVDDRFGDSLQDKTLAVSRTIVKLTEDNLRELFENETRKLHLDQGMSSVGVARAFNPELQMNGIFFFQLTKSQNKLKININLFYKILKEN